MIQQDKQTSMLGEIIMNWIPINILINSTFFLKPNGFSLKYIEISLAMNLEKPQTGNMALQNNSMIKKPARQKKQL